MMSQSSLWQKFLHLL